MNELVESRFNFSIIRLKKRCMTCHCINSTCVVEISQIWHCIAIYSICMFVLHVDIIKSYVHTLYIRCCVIMDGGIALKLQAFMLKC